MRRLPVCACLLIVLAAPAAASTPTIDALAPGSVRLSTAKLAIADGTGDKRLALWTATSSRNELCVGWRVGASTERPKSFTCLRRGLDRPLLDVEYGGGFSGVGTWGVIVGLASPLIDRISTETLWGSRTVREIPLTSRPGPGGWRVFSTGSLEHPTSTKLKAYDAQGELVIKDSGAGIRPPQTTACNYSPGADPRACVGTQPLFRPGDPRILNGPPWSDTSAKLGESSSDEQAISAALALPAVREILSANRSWLEATVDWETCDGRPLGRVVEFRFASPASFTATLPIMGRAGASAYSTGIQTVRGEEWNELNVMLDTNVGAVVGVNSRPVVALDRPEGKTTTLKTIVPEHDAGGPDDHAPCSRG